MYNEIYDLDSKTTVTAPARKRVRRGNQEDADQLRQELMQAAVELVAEQGVHALTVRAVAQRVGVSAMTPYRYFADKTELLEGVWRLAMEAMGKRVSAAVAATRGGRAKQRASIDAFMGYWEEHPDYYCLLFGFDRVGQQHQASAKVADSALYARLLEVAAGHHPQRAAELGAGMQHARSPATCGWPCSSATCRGTMIVTRYPWSEATALRATYVEQIVLAVERCLQHGPLAPAKTAAPRKRAAAKAGPEPPGGP